MLLLTANKRERWARKRRGRRAFPFLFLMSDQSNDPYSRLQALQRMGIVQDYSIIRNKSIAIVGIGGLGSIAAEMLCRMGCGRLILFDYDSVELANMNRMFFTREQVGMKKTKAAVETLSRLNPDVHVEARDMNVTRLASYEPFKRDVLGVDLLLCTVDNYSARLVVNQVCLETGKQWLESGVSETAISGHIQNMVPGQTACFEVNQIRDLKAKVLAGCSL